MWSEITKGLEVLAFRGLGWGSSYNFCFLESQPLFLRERDLIRPKFVTSAFSLLNTYLQHQDVFLCSLFQLTHQGNMANPQSTWLPAPIWASTFSLQPWSFLLQVKTEKMERKTWWILFSPFVRACLQPGDRWHSPLVWKPFIFNILY